MTNYSPETLEWAANFTTPAKFAQFLDPFKGNAEREYKTPPHISYISDLVADAVFEGNRFIIVGAPPRHGKSWLLSKFTPAWFLEMFPEKWVIMASHSQELANRWGREVRNLINDKAEDLTVRLSSDSKAAHRWNTQQGGGMVAIGVDGGITGWGGDLVIVDDPFKTREEANSKTLRDKVWEWWTDTLFSRLQPGATVILIMQRWHQDDLAGRLISQSEENKEDPDAIKWEVINFPAIIETEEQEEADILGRKIGDVLWEERYDAPALKRIRATTSALGWSSQYQQQPTVSEGQVFQRKFFRYYERKTTEVGGEEKVFYRLYLPDDKTRDYFETDLRVFQAVDTAQKAKTIHDYSVVATIGKTPDGHYLILDIARDRLEVPEQLDFILAQRRKWNPIWQGIEDKQSGTGILQQAARMGLPMFTLKAVTDKVDRATTGSILYQNGQVFHPRTASWLYPMEEELLAFPNGVHDDIVDAVSYVLREVGDEPGIYLL